MIQSWFSSLQTRLLVCIMIMSVLLLLFSVPIVWEASRNNERAQYISTINSCSKPFFAAVEALSFERGRTYIILSNDWMDMKTHLAIIKERRMQAGQNMEVGLARLREVDPVLTEQLQLAYTNFLSLRDRADQQAVLPPALRDPDFPKEWFVQSTVFISELINALEIIGHRNHAPDLFYFNYHFQLDCIYFRVFAGENGSLLIAAASQGKTIPNEQYQSFIESRGKVDYLWSHIDRQLEVSHNSILRQKKEKVFHEYYGIYRPYQNEFAHQVVQKPVAEEKVKQLVEISAPAMDAIFDLVSAADLENCDYINEIKAKAAAELRWAYEAVFLMVVGIVFIYGYFMSSLFRPLQRIIAVIQSIAQGHADADLHLDKQRKDEIGWLARGVLVLQSKMKKEQELNLKNEVLANTDSLTGIYNRHMFKREIKAILARADLCSEPISMAALDLDNFKKVNDSWGHAVGDQVLKRMVRTVEAHICKEDYFFRFGGEEFIILMPGVALAAAADAAENLRIVLAQVAYPEAGQVTVSIGIAERRREECFQLFYKRADENLYRAKKYGRNRVVGSVDAVRQVIWRSEWESGHPEIDHQHRELFEKTKELVELTELFPSEQAHTLVKIDAILEKIKEHFDAEMQVLRQFGYPHVHEHQTMHEDLLLKAAELHEKCLKNESGASAFILFIFDDIILEHTVKEDILFFPYTKK
ncbi:diguanylate cyclase [Anaerosinus massiliensis]|uniref:diguanylate cyclase n=1 Tax=Massilibacillus massiliensis TaxID=1806837 RepID=UPI000AF822C5|nr:diguanylate cyclase [Massilibacillus massiliensis]